MGIRETEHALLRNRKDSVWIFGVILIQRVMERMIKKKQLFGVTEGDVKL